MISSIDKMPLQRVEMGDDGDKGRTDTIQETKLIDKMHFQRVEILRS